MTGAQRRIANTWIAGTVGLLAVVIFAPWAEDHPRVANLVLFVAMAFAILFERPFPRRPGAVARAVERHPVLKLWYAICGVSVLAALVITTHSQFRLDQEIGIRGLILIFVALLGPIVYALELERFKDAGE